jgi:hypothetical protein
MPASNYAATLEHTLRQQANRRYLMHTAPARPAAPVWYSPLDAALRAQDVAWRWALASASVLVPGGAR